MSHSSPRHKIDRFRCLAALGICLFAGCATPNSVLLERADVAMADGQPMRAEAFLARAMAQDATDWRVHYRVGELRLENQRPLDAQINFEQALALRPDHPESGQIIEKLAQALLMQGKYDAMGKLLADRAAQTGDKEDYLRQGRFLAQIGDVDAALLAYRKALAVAAPDDPEPNLVIASLYESIGDEANALLHLRYAYYRQPDNPAIADDLRRYGIVPGPTAALEPPSH